MFDDGGRMSEVREPGQSLSRPGVLRGAVDGEADRIGRIVWDGDRGHLQAADLEGRAGLKELPIHIGFYGVFYPPGGLTISKNLQEGVLTEQGGQPDAVIGVFMGDHYGVQRARFETEFL